MYQAHFALTERPFSIAPDPRFLYMSGQHREALAHLLYGVGEGGGFVLLTGEVGTGKTTICRGLLEQLPPHVDLALILNPRVNARELLASVCDELDIPYARDTTSIKTLTDLLNAYLLDSHARGRRTVLMIDEAQNLSAEVLEQVRLLTNLETTREKLLQIILVGQPELRTLLARDNLRQLSQRITARYHLEPLDGAETAAYIRHRLAVCGATEQLFADAAIDLVHRLSKGVPRLINVLCDRALLGAFVEGKRRVDRSIVRKAAGEVLPGAESAGSRRHSARWLAAAAVLVALGMGTYPLLQHGALQSLLSVDRTTREPQSSGIAVASAPLPGTGDAAGGRQEASPPADTPPPMANGAAPADLATAPNLPVAMAAAAASPARPEDTQLPPSGPATASPSTSPPTPSAAEPTPVEAYVDAGLEHALSQAGPDAARHAWAGLYRLWGVQADVSGDDQACARAPAVGVRCMLGSGSWTLLTQMDRPAILLLIDAHGRRIPVLLEELAGKSARVQVDGTPLVLPIDQLTPWWLGHYRVLWKTPPQGSAVLRPGDHGSDVTWLREQLQQATGRTPAAPDPAHFDAGLEQALRDFQRHNALAVDGIAGPRTMIYLNNRGHRASLPRLGVGEG